MPKQPPKLKFDARGPAVQRLQGLIRAASPGLTDADLSLGGWFGPVTLGHVKRLQAEYGLPVTGVVDIATWRALLGLPPRP